jgi:hypothetical protein
MEQAVDATAKLGHHAHRDYQETPKAFTRYKNVLRKDGDQEQWGFLIHTFTLYSFLHPSYKVNHLRVHPKPD